MRNRSIRSSASAQPRWRRLGSLRSPRRSLWLAGALSLLASLAVAQSLGAITVGDLAGTGGHWQFGTVTVAAPADEVQRWFSDASRWSVRFPDTEWAQSLGVGPDGRRIVRFRSRVIGRPLTLHMSETRGAIFYDGEGKDVTTQGKIFIERLGPTRTRVLLQSTSEVHGAAGIFASLNARRQRAYRKFRADLSSVVRLSAQWAAAQRRGG
jgi:hypothetical protein